MIVIAQAPCRISLFGGGTDLPSYKRGVVVNLAINLRCHVQLNVGDDTWSAENEVPHNANRDLFHSILKEFGYGSMHHSRFIGKSDASVGAGLGTSGAAGVALIKAISKTKGIEFNSDDLAERAFSIESRLWNTGRQDVYASSYGGMNILYFGLYNNSKVVRVGVQKPIAERLKRYMYLYYIGGDRKPQKKILSNLDNIRDLALEAIGELDDPKKIGKLLNKSWEFKKKSNPNVSNNHIDKIYKQALKNGCWGGKVCGSGGAGYMVFISPKNPKLDLEEVDFSIDYTGVEARIL